MLVLLAFDIVLAIAGISKTIADIGLLDRIRRGELVFEDEIARADERSMILGAVAIALLIVSGIVWIGERRG